MTGRWTKQTAHPRSCQLRTSFIVDIGKDRGCRINFVVRDRAQMHIVPLTLRTGCCILYHKNSLTVAEEKTTLIEIESVKRKGI